MSQPTVPGTLVGGFLPGAVPSGTAVGALQTAAIVTTHHRTAPAETAVNAPSWSDALVLCSWLAAPSAFSRCAHLIFHASFSRVNVWICASLLASNWTTTNGKCHCCACSTTPVRTPHLCHQCHNIIVGRTTAKCSRCGGNRRSRGGTASTSRTTDGPSGNSRVGSAGTGPPRGVGTTRGHLRRSSGGCGRYCGWYTWYRLWHYVLGGGRGFRDRLRFFRGGFGFGGLLFRTALLVFPGGAPRLWRCHSLLVAGFAQGTCILLAIGLFQELKHTASGSLLTCTQSVATSKTGAVRHRK